jgi:hypothetical protein
MLSRRDAIAELVERRPLERPAEAARLAAARRQREVLGNRHRRRRCADRVLWKHAPDERGAAVLGPRL